jgi:hypothetical protein
VPAPNSVLNKSVELNKYANMETTWLPMCPSSVDNMDNFIFLSSMEETWHYYDGISNSLSLPGYGGHHPHLSHLMGTMGSFSFEYGCSGGVLC